MIEGNEPFFAKIAPRLQAGKPLGYDLIVLTNGWQLTQLIEQRLARRRSTTRLLPNFAATPPSIAKNPNYDPGNRYTIPWQSGFTGIAYNTKAIDREITSVEDLWDPAFKGRVGMMSDNTDLGTAGLLYLGLDPATSTTARLAGGRGRARTSGRSCAATTTRATSTTWRRAARGSARRGRATSSRRTHPGTRTCASWCRRRA